jgi:hypothetical protein
VKALRLGPCDLSAQLAFDVVKSGLGEHPVPVKRLVGEQLAGVRVKQRRAEI